jgi:uncharacterized protein YbjT (DUF2867 family)
MRTALIVGASGLVGKACLYELLEAKEYTRIIAVVRRPLAIKYHQLEQLVVDFYQLDRYADQFKADDVFCCLGTTIKVAGSQENFRKVDFDYPVKVAELAHKNGAEQFLIVSAMGADSGSKIFYSRVKGEVEEAVSNLGYPAVHIFRPSLLVGDRREVRAGELIGKYVMMGIGFLFMGPLRKYKAIHGGTVAKAMVKTALKNQHGQFVYQSDRIADIGGPIVVRKKVV